MFCSIIRIQGLGNELGGLDVAYEDWLNLDWPELSDAEVAARQDRVPGFIHDHATQLPPAARATVTAALQALVRLVQPEDCVDQALALGLLHFSLPAEQQQQRTNHIAQLFAMEFDELPQTDDLQPLWSLLESLRLRALLLPDGMLEREIRKASFLIRSEMFTARGTPARYAQVIHVANPILQAWPATHDLWDPLLRTSLFTRRPAERDEFLKNLRALIDREAFDAVSSAGVRAVALSLGDVMTGDLVSGVIAAVAESANDPIDEIIDAQWQMLATLNNIAVLQTVNACIKAFRASLDLGPAITRSIQDTLKLTQRLQAQSASRPAPAARPFRRQPLTIQAPGATDDTGRNDACQAWSLEKVVAWTQGPIAATGVKQPINRAAVAAQETSLQRTPRVGKQRVRVTPKDVADTIEVGLRATGQFFLGEMQDLLSNAKALGLNAASTKACNTLLPQLQQLVGPSKSGGVDELAARQLLQQAESAIAALRQQIKSTQTNDRMQTRFLVQLNRALSNELLELGKRQGGVINCRMSLKDWPWVVEQFHKTHLSHVTSLLIDGVHVPLGEDMALGLYVTASSQSHYAFDVSVHLWRRLPGRTSSASEAGAVARPYPALNTTDWFDTYIPCAVLHVPPGQ
ncbi:MAG: hypothetical protein DCF26_10985 [Burkholderiales bacterium]|nr:MAG: hypothetical protein DCF26_10985 [Burkholderiales bacterium]